MKDSKMTYQELESAILEAGYNISNSDTKILILDDKFRLILTIAKFAKNRFDNHYEAYDLLSYNQRQEILGLITNFLMTPIDYRCQMTMEELQEKEKENIEKSKIEIRQESIKNVQMIGFIKSVEFYKELVEKITNSLAEVRYNTSCRCYVIKVKDEEFKIDTDNKTDLDIIKELIEVLEE